MDSLTIEERDLLARVLEKPELQPFFFRKLKGLKWFAALAEHGFFAPEKNLPPQPAREEGYVSVPFWPAMEYLGGLGRELTETDEKYPRAVLEILRRVTSHARDLGFSNYRTWWQFSKVIQNIPVDLVQLADLQMVDYWLSDPYDFSLVGSEIGEKWLLGLLENSDRHSQQIALGVLDLLFRPQGAGDSGKRKERFRLSEWHAEKISSKVANKAGRALAFEAVDVIREHLETALAASDNDKWSSIWRRAIEDHEQDKYRDDAADILVSTLRDCLLGAIESKKDSSREYVQALVRSEWSVLARIGVYAINVQFAFLRGLVDEVLTPKFFSSNFRHETWHLLKNRYSEFADKEQARALDIILTHEEKDEKHVVRDGPTAYWRAIWLAALKSHAPDLQRQYEKYVGLVGAEPEHPDFSSYMTSGFVVHRSPYQLDELVALPVEGLVARLAAFRDPGRFREPGIEGLAKAVRELVKAEPLRYSAQLHLFVDVDLAYVYEVIEGFHEVWNQKKALPWDDVWRDLLSFCRLLVHDEMFWSAQNADRREAFVANRHWIVGAISRLVEDGAKSDDHAFPESLLPMAEEVIGVLLNRQEGEEFKNTEEAVSIAINSPRGRALEALINLALRASRLEHQRKQNHEMVWSRFGPIFESEFKRADSGDFEFQTLVTMYLLNFMYLSSEWTLKNLPRAFDQSNQRKWRCAIEGYGQVNDVHPQIYAYLKENGDYMRALDDDLIKDRVQEKVVQNIVVGYLRSYEKLTDENSLIRKLIGRKRHEEMTHLIWFLWTLRDAEDEELRARILNLWPAIQSVLDLREDNDQRIASRLTTWVAFIDELTVGQKGLLLSILPFVEKEHHAFEILEAIARISAKQPEDAYALWMEMLNGSRPDFPPEALRDALRNITMALGPRSAKNIADQYLKHGNAGPAEVVAELLQGTSSSARPSTS